MQVQVLLARPCVINSVVEYFRDMEGASSSNLLSRTKSGLLVKWDNSAMAWQHREFDSPTVHHKYQHEGVFEKLAADTVCAACYSAVPQIHTHNNDISRAWIWGSVFGSKS